MIASRQEQLSGRDNAKRIAVIAGITGILLVLRLVDPESLSWFPLPTSCGAISGLPCLFCGTTRAMHYLLRGDIARALYFNWLAVPVLLSAIAAILILSVEVACGRLILRDKLCFRLTSQRIAAIASGVVALWVLQISLAVSLHKTELLNAAGPLYGLFVR